MYGAAVERSDECGQPLAPATRRIATIAALKAQLSGIIPQGGSASAAVQAWTLGAAEIDGLLGPVGLESGGVHDIALEFGAGDGAGDDAGGGRRDGLGDRAGSEGGRCNLAAVTASARLFALTLLRRRLRPAGIQSGVRSGVLWCVRAPDLAEGGQLYAPALARMGFDPGQIIVVTPQHRAAVLWAMEEGLRSGALAAVVGQIDDIGLTPARRLALAAAATNTPCLLVAVARAGPVAAVATRWRIGPLPGGPQLNWTPGAWRLALTLERCRSRPVGSGARMFAVEWSDDTHCFRVVAGSADRAAASGQPGGAWCRAEPIQPAA
jgi:protein ImuA